MTFDNTSVLKSKLRWNSIAKPLGGQGLQLFLLVQNHLDQKGLVNGIQLFFGVSDCHSGAPFLIGAIIADMPHFRQPVAVFPSSL